MMIPLSAMVLMLTLQLAAQSAGGKPPLAEATAKTVVTAADLSIARRAAELLSSPEKWNRINKDKCPAEARKFRLYCALEKASQEEQRQEDDHRAVM